LSTTDIENVALSIPFFYLGQFDNLKLCDANFIKIYVPFKWNWKWLSNWHHKVLNCQIGRGRKMVEIATFSKSGFNKLDEIYIFYVIFLHFTFAYFKLLSVMFYLV